MVAAATVGSAKAAMYGVTRTERVATVAAVAGMTAEAEAAVEVGVATTVV